MTAPHSLVTALPCVATLATSSSVSLSSRSLAKLRLTCAPPPQPRELDRGLMRLQQPANELGNIFSLQGRGTYIMLPSCDNALPHRTAASQARQLPKSGEGAELA